VAEIYHVENYGGAFCDVTLL